MSAWAQVALVISLSGMASGPREKRSTIVSIHVGSWNHWMVVGSDDYHVNVVKTMVRDAELLKWSLNVYVNFWTLARNARLCLFNVLNASGVFGDVRKLALLSGWPWFTLFGHTKCQWFVVSTYTVKCQKCLMPRYNASNSQSQARTVFLLRFTTSCWRMLAVPNICWPIAGELPQLSGQRHLL